MSVDGDDDPDPGLAPPLPPSDRLTLDFTGPPLALPSDEGAADAPPRRRAPSSRPPRPRTPAPFPVHDAWSRDRMRRGSDVHAIPAADGGYDEPLDDEHVEDEEEEAVRDSIVPGAPQETSALRLVDRQRRMSPTLDLAAEMTDKYALGDFTGSLSAAELLLGRDPTHSEARRTAQAAREQLAQFYTSRLGALARVPLVSVPDQEVRWLGLDNRAGFLLSRVNGTHSLEEIIDVSGMQRLEALKLLAELYDAGAIRFEE